MIRRIKKSKAERLLSYTKRIVTALTVLAALWISWSYVLATTALLMYGNVDPLSTVSEEVCRTIIATVIGYCVKAMIENISKYTVAEYLETKHDSEKPPDVDTDMDMIELDAEG